MSVSLCDYVAQALILTVERGYLRKPKIASCHHDPSFTSLSCTSTDVVYRTVWAGHWSCLRTPTS